jgi:phosphatidylinositol alpha-1,6-mannosyltransferase
MKQHEQVRCLLVANIFAPINGGSAIVYESLARFAEPGSIRILAPWKHYQTRQEIEGWREHDASVAYAVDRIELLRPPVMPKPPRHPLESAWRVLTIDLPIYLKVLIRVASIIRRQRINLLCIGELASSTWIGGLCKRVFGIPYINYIHGEEITVDMPYRRFGRKRRKYLHEADGVVAVSEFTARALEDLMGVARDKIRLIHNGVDVERFTPSAAHDDILARHGLTGRRVILSVGRLVARKGFDRMIEAMPAVLAQCPDAHYVLVGDGEYRDTLEMLVDRFGVRERVTFAGSVSVADLPRYYQSCDLFVMPNRRMPDGDTEGFGLVFLEANACHKAVVGGRAGGAVEAVRDGENGLLVDGDDPLQIARAVVRILTDDALRRSLEDRGLECARASSWQVQAQRFHAFCQEIVDAREAG